MGTNDEPDLRNAFGAVCSNCGCRGRSKLEIKMADAAMNLPPQYPAWWHKPNTKLSWAETRRIEYEQKGRTIAVLPDDAIQISTWERMPGRYAITAVHWPTKMEIGYLRLTWGANMFPAGIERPQIIKNLSEAIACKTLTQPSATQVEIIGKRECQ
jgi:hypothetical protein